jgi:hypothetical protein
MGIGARLALECNFHGPGHVRRHLRRHGAL